MPLGAGLLYVRKEKIAALWPLFGDQGFADTDIRKLNHTGTHPVHTDLAIAHAIAFHESIGVQRKEARMRYLQQYWTTKVRGIRNIEVNTPSDPQRAAGIANVGIATMAPGVLAKTLLDKYRIWTVAIDRPNVKGARITPHLYTTPAELDVLVERSERVARRRSRPPRENAPDDCACRVCSASGLGTCCQVNAHCPRLPCTACFSLCQVAEQSDSTRPGAERTCGIRRIGEAMSEVRIKRQTDEARTLPVFKEIEKRFDAVRARAYDLFSSRGKSAGSDLDDWVKAERELLGWSPGELKDRENEYEVDFALPGFGADDVELTATPTELIVHAENKSERTGESDRVVWSEFGSSEIYRRFALPTPVLADRVSAEAEEWCAQGARAEVLPERGGNGPTVGHGAFGGHSRVISSDSGAAAHAAAI